MTIAGRAAKAVKKPHKRSKKPHKRSKKPHKRSMGAAKRSSSGHRPFGAPNTIGLERERGGSGAERAGGGAWERRERSGAFRVARARVLVVRAGRVGPSRGGVRPKPLRGRYVRWATPRRRSRHSMRARAVCAHKDGHDEGKARREEERALVATHQRAS